MQLALVKRRKLIIVQSIFFFFETKNQKQIHASMTFLENVKEKLRLLTTRRRAFPQYLT